MNNTVDSSPLIKATNELREVVEARSARIEARVASESRGAWSAAGGVMVAVGVGAAVALASAAATPQSKASTWPIYVFGAVALTGLYVLFAPLVRWWPFTWGSTASSLDARIRAGHQARERITKHHLGVLDEAIEYARWDVETEQLLCQRYPVIVDRFRLASGDKSKFSGQALLIQTINAKLAVLTEARESMPG